MALSSLSYVLIFGSAFLVGFSKTSAGGVGMLILILMTAAVPAKTSLGIQLPMMFFADIMAIIIYRRNCDWAVLVKIFPITACGIVLGYLIIDRISQEVFLPTLGFIIIFLLVAEYLSERRAAPIGYVSTIFIGFLAGVSAMMANAAGALISPYLLGMKLPKQGIVGTRSWYFMFVNALKVPLALNLGLVSSETLAINAIYLPVVIFGAYIGWKSTNLISLRLFKWWIRVVSLFAAAKFIFF
jgi:uncharacterized protein